MNKEADTLDDVTLAADLVVYGPGLSRSDVELLILCAVTPHWMRPEQTRAAARLRRWGLLRTASLKGGVTRPGTWTTEKGRAVIDVFRRKGWIK